MPPTVIDVRAADDIRDVVHRAVQAVAEGKLVVFPTETVYGVAARALDADAVARLVDLKGRRRGHPMTLAIRSAEEAGDYVPHMSQLADRLARRCWPGPVTLVLDNSHPESLVKQLPAPVQDVVCPNGTVGLRVPGHEIILDVMRMVAGPLVLTSANLSGQPETLNAQDVVESLAGGVDLVLDDGPSRFGEPSSVISVEGNAYRILRTGIVPERTIKRLASLMLLFVCTGNTCRSPMAEAICRGKLSDHLGCHRDEVEDRGLIIMSAGVAAMSGGRATPHAVQVISAMGMDLSLHETQPLTEPLVRYADLIYTMTQSHRQAIVAQWPHASTRTQLLRPDGADVCDPIGGPIERYQRCAMEIDGQVEVRLNELDLKSVIR